MISDNDLVGGFGGREINPFNKSSNGLSDISAIYPQESAFENQRSSRGFGDNVRAASDRLG